MASLPRLLVLMGSGETAASMAPVHRAVLARLRQSGRPVRAALIDTPYGFQENAGEISASAVAYFERRVGMRMSVASIRRADDDPRERQAALARLRRADFVFSGPGSPSYALRHWTASDVPTLLAEKLASGGAIVMASAAALTLGRLTAPIYEMYKVGTDPHWLPGLDLLSPHGLPAVVLPHYDNAEGRGHDTRYSFIGERRLRTLETDLPADTFLMGVDEHTAVILDLDAGRVTIHGRGGLTVRRSGRTIRFEPPQEPSFAELRAAALMGDAGGRGRARRTTAPGDAGSDAGSERRTDATPHAPVDDEAARLAVLVEPLVEALVEARAAARAGGDYAAADTIRERLHALGCTLSDTPDGTRWSLPDPDSFDAAGPGRRPSDPGAARRFALPAEPPRSEPAG